MKDEQQLKLFPTYGDDFLSKHAGKIITDPGFAIVELVANAWDAGATQVKITWPTQAGEGIRIEDNGIGMTEEEFTQRWLRLNYNRLENQGKFAEFPPNQQKSHRVVFGRNGIGRHAMFCFGNEYSVETCKSGQYIKAIVRRSIGETPYQVFIQKRAARKKPGTTIYVSQSTLSSSFISNELNAKKIGDLIGSRFIADPRFNISVNDEPVTFENLKELSVEISSQITEGQEIKIRRFDSEKMGKTTKQNGIAWWVNNRLVGHPNWQGREGSILDGLLDEWSVRDAQKVLGELQFRLKLIDRLEGLVDAKTTDELHELQPLFERGLWIFGPKFESIDFSSNRTLATVVKKFFGDAILTLPKHRPDFVIIPDTSLGIYSCDAFDSDNEVSGLSSVIIVELKRGGFTISYKEKDQALKYARELKRTGKVTRETEITCYVLGSSVDPEAEEPSNEGKITVYPRTYSSILRQANARTFHLLNQLQDFQIAHNKLTDNNLDDDLELAQGSFFQNSAM